MSDLIEGFFDLLASAADGRSGRKTKCNHCGKIAFTIAAAFIALVVYMWPSWETTSATKLEARALCSDENYPGGAVDGWGNEMAYKTYEVEQPLATKCEVRSSGRDEEFHTDDDITYTAQNLHVLRSIGRAAGEKAKGMWGEFMNGFKSGSPPVEE